MLQLKGNFILVKPKEVEEKTKSGIVLPEQYRKTQQQVGQLGEVVACGDGTLVEEFIVDGDRAYRSFKKRPINEFIKTGAIVLFKRYTGMEVTVEGTKYLILKEFDIEAIVEE
jgi:chaperonin GroES